jgi:Uma2 family endonuclease
MEALSSGGIVYPESDGKRLAENTAQYHWIEVLKGNLDALLPSDFVAADLLWYPIEGDNQTRAAPDVMVALSRPKGGRSSYRQWEEGGIAPQFVVEILSPGNNPDEMRDKRDFYETHGVLEYLVIDPDQDEPERAILEVWVRRRGVLQLARFTDTWKSQTLGITFVREDGRLTVQRPDGAPFLTFANLAKRLEDANAERDAATARARRLAERLRALGLDPDEVDGDG